MFVNMEPLATESSMKLMKPSATSALQSSKVEEVKF